MKIKHLLLSLIPVLIFATGCKFDDSDIWDELNSQKTEITDQGTQISNLSARVTALETNVSTLQQLVNALRNNITITSVNQTDNGYIINFSDGTRATITNGAKGEDGKDGASPVIGVAQSIDGTWYWTVNGLPLTYTDGTMVKVPSDTRETPQLKIEEDKWYISYDKGTTWEELKVSGKISSDAIFKGVKTEGKYAYFTLADDTVLTIPLAEDAVKLQLVFDESVFARMKGGQTRETTYEIKAADDATVSLETWESDGWTVSITQTTSRTGTISITAPALIKSSKILFSLSDDKGGSFVKIIRIEPDNGSIETYYTVDSGAGDLVIPVTDTKVTISDDAASWISVKSSGDSLVLHFVANDTYDRRTGTVTLQDGTVLTVAQAQNDAIVLSDATIEITGEAQQVPVVLSANVDVTTTVEQGSDWLTITPQTRALESKTITLYAALNETGTQRSASVVFTGGSASQTVTILQNSVSVPGTITGVVLNASTGEALQGVTVTCGELTATTGSDGKYSIEVPEIGSYTLTFTTTSGLSYSTSVSASDFVNHVATVPEVRFGSDDIFPTLKWQNLASAQIWYHNDYRGRSGGAGITSWANSYLSAMPVVGFFRCENEGYAIQIRTPNAKGASSEGDENNLNAFLYGRKRISEGNKILSVYARTFETSDSKLVHFGLQVLDLTAGATKAVKVGQTYTHDGGYAPFTFDLSDFVGHEIAFAFGSYFYTGTEYAQLSISRMCFASEAVANDTDYLPGTAASGLTEGWHLTTANISSMTVNDRTSFTGLNLGLNSSDGENGARRTHNPWGQQGYSLWVGSNHLMESWAFMYLDQEAEPVNSEGYTIRTGQHTGADYDTPVSYIYSKFHITDANDEMTMKVRTFSYTPTVFKVTAIKDSGEAAAIEPSSYQLPSSANNQESAGKVEGGKGCWQLALQRGTSSEPDNYATFTYDLSSYKGQDVVIAIGVHQGEEAVNSLQLCFYSIEMK